MYSTTAAARPMGRPLVVAIALAALTISALMAFRPAAVAAFTAGENGHPTSGPYSDLKGGTASFTFETDATLTCDANDGAKGFDFTVNYSVSGAALPAGATLVVYLSPNQGAINGNAGGDEAGYVTQVESNYSVIDVAGLSGSGTIAVDLAVTHGFTLATGGVLGVFASENGGQGWTAKTNSLNCSEAEGSPTPTEQPTEQPTATPEQSEQGSTGTPAPTPEGSVKGGTGTPAPSLPDGAMIDAGGPSPLPTVLFGLMLLASLATLAWVNVRAVRSRA